MNTKDMKLQGRRRNMSESERILNEFGKGKIQKAFNVSLMHALKENSFLKKYFIRRLPVKELRKAEKKSLIQVFEGLPNKEDVINTIFENIFDAACSELVYKLGIEISNKTLLGIIDSLDEDTVIEQFISDIESILEIEQDNILEELRKRKIIDSNLIDLDEVSDIDDSIGDIYELNEKLDYDTRESAFVDIDGTILISDKGKSHAQLIQDYIDKTLNEDIKLEKEWYRPSEEEVQEILKNKYTAFGHVFDDNIFIETLWLENTSIDEIINDINNAGVDYNKIYEYANEEITRVARMIK